MRLTFVRVGIGLLACSDWQVQVELDAYKLAHDGVDRLAKHVVAAKK